MTDMDLNILEPQESLYRKHKDIKAREHHIQDHIILAK
jgi:hypothetical protein